jgi:hypothetical protein
MTGGPPQHAGTTVRFRGANSGVFVFPCGEDLRGLPGVIPWHYQRKRPARNKVQGVAKRAQGNGRHHLTCTKRHTVPDHTNPALMVLVEVP